MATDSERITPAGAIMTALTMVEALHGRDGEDPEGAQEAIQVGIAHWGHEVIVDG